MKVFLDIVYYLFFWGTITNPRVSKKLDCFFWKTMCPRPDRKPFRVSMFLYNLTGRMAFRFHERHCSRCMK